MQWIHMAVIFVLSVVTLVFAVQNFESVTLDFLGIRVSAPLALLVILVYLLGMVTGGSLWALIRWAIGERWRAARSRRGPRDHPSCEGHKFTRGEPFRPSTWTLGG
jgi:uncharacterized integral membrane protein